MASQAELMQPVVTYVLQPTCAHVANSPGLVCVDVLGVDHIAQAADRNKTCLWVVIKARQPMALYTGTLSSRTQLNWPSLAERLA